MIDLILSKISTAFSSVTLGDGMTLLQGRLMDDWATDKEIQQAGNCPKPNHWQEVSERELEELADAVAFLCPRGFCFYLPAFMGYSLRHYDSSDNMASNVAILSLVLYPEVNDSQLRRFEALSAAQCSVVRQFLDYFCYVKRDPIACRALESYWAQVPVTEEENAVTEEKGNSGVD